MRLINFKPTLILPAIALMAGAVISPAITAISVAAAGADDGDGCRQVRARVMNTIVNEGCTSPVGLCTAGVVTGSGLLNGPNTVTFSGLALSAGLPGIVPETMSFAAERVIITKRGTLTLSVVGIFDSAPTAMGEFANLEKVVGGTGQFAEATGTLHVFGRATADGSGFVGNIRGEICFAAED